MTTEYRLSVDDNSIFLLLLPNEIALNPGVMSKDLPRRWADDEIFGPSKSNQGPKFLDRLTGPQGNPKYLGELGSAGHPKPKEMKFDVDEFVDGVHPCLMVLEAVNVQLSGTVHASPQTRSSVQEMLNHAHSGAEAGGILPSASVQEMLDHA